MGGGTVGWGGWEQHSGADMFRADLTNVSPRDLICGPRGMLRKQKAGADLWGQSPARTEPRIEYMFGSVNGGMSWGRRSGSGWSGSGVCLASDAGNGNVDLDARNGRLGDRVAVLEHQFNVIFDRFCDEGDGRFAGLASSYATWEVWKVSAITGGASFDDDGVFRGPCSPCNPACVMMSLQVLGGRSVLGLPAMATVPDFTG